IKALKTLRNSTNPWNVLRLEADPRAMQHHFVMDGLRPDGQAIAGRCHVVAHGGVMAVFGEKSNWRDSRTHHPLPPLAYRASTFPVKGEVADYSLLASGNASTKRRF